MKKLFTLALFWHLFTGSLFSLNSFANTYPSSKSASENPLFLNYPYLNGFEYASVEKSSNSDLDDFVIRRKVDFNNHSDGYYSNSQYLSDWKSGSLYSPNTTQIRTVDGSKVLASYYKKGTWGRGGGLNQWADFRDSKDDITEIYWTFRIKYQSDFDWGLGNKLPGVSFGPVQTVASGGAGPNIGNKGSSLRLVQTAGGKLNMYVYHHNMSGTYGDNMGKGSFGQLKKGEWQELTVRLVANQVGKANGIMQVWLDGVLVASVQNIEMRTSASPQTIGGLALHTFMGGADVRFAPDRNQFMWMDDIHFWQYSDEFLAKNSSVASGLELHSASHKLYTPISGYVEEQVNSSPTVSITSIKSNDKFTEGDNVSITANAADSDGSISKVDFYNGSTHLGTDYSSPYTFGWSNMPIGTFSLTARATDNDGAASVSSVISIDVSKKEDLVSKPDVDLGKEPEIDLGLGSEVDSGEGLLEGLVSFYEMNSNISNKLVDSHGSNHGINKQTDHVDGFNERGNRYDGKSSISSVPHSSSLNLSTEFTIMADIYREGTGQKSGSIIVGKTFSSSWTQNQAYSIGITSDNKIKIRTNTSSLKDWVSSQTLPLGKWVRVIATYKSGEGYSLYLDTIVPENSYKFSGTIATSNLELTIGSATESNNAASNRRVEGILDNVGIWNRQLAQSEIEKLINTKISYPDFADEYETASVRIVSPVEKSEFDGTSDIQIEIESESNDAVINKVELYNGTTWISTLDSKTFKYTWEDVPAGEHSLMAKVIDSNGTVVESDPVSFSVLENAVESSKPGAGLLDGLVSFYEMNTNSSNVLRDSHGQNHGTNKQTSHVNAFSDKGNRYDGNSSISSVPHSSSLNLSTEFTLMADIYREGNGQNSSSVIIGKTHSSGWAQNQAYSIAITKDNKIKVRTNVPSLKDWVSTQTVPLGKWVRVIATYKSGEGYSLYMDTKVAEKSYKFSGTIDSSNMELTIGSATSVSNAANNRRVEGILDNVGIWNRQLEQSEIEQLITTKITYPDFSTNQTYRITMAETTGENLSKITSSSINAEAGEKLVFLAEEKDVVFDHWSIDGQTISDHSILELNMPQNDITLTKHFRSFVAPEATIILPSQEEEFEAFSKVYLSLDTKSNDAVIQKVEIFNGEVLVGKLAEDGAGLNWENIPLGNHELVAKITDINGKTYSSEPVVLKAVEFPSNEIPNVLLDYVIGPNPTSEHLNVFFTNLDGVYDFEINVVSMNGSVQKTYEVRPEGDSLTIDVSGLLNGVYVLQLTANGNSVVSKKFIKH